MTDTTEERLFAKLSGTCFVHSVLLVVEKPKIMTGVEQQAWQGFLGEVGNINTQDGAAEKLGEGCWLIPVQKSLSVFVTLAHAAQSQRLTYRVLFLQRAPEWIQSS